MNSNSFIKNSFCLLFTFMALASITQAQQLYPYSDGFASPLSNQNLVFTEERDDVDEWKNDRDFGDSNHLGEDWNHNDGGNSDEGMPIYSTSNGIIEYSGYVSNCWGNVVIIRHYVPSLDAWVESMYGHLSSTESYEIGEIVAKGTKIGEMGGEFYDCSPIVEDMKSHLHFEIRDENCAFWGKPGPGYSANNTGWLEPSTFIENHRSEPLIINDFLATHGGTVGGELKKRKVWFKLEGVTNDLTISNFKIGETSIPQDIIEEVTIVGEDKVEFYLNLPRLTNIPDGWKNGESYDVSFEATSNGVVQEYYSPNLLYFIDPSKTEDLPEGAWYVDYVKRGMGIGLFQGTTNTPEKNLFDPSATMTRAQMCKVVTEVGVKLDLIEINPSTDRGTFADVSPSHWSYPYIMTLRGLDWKPGEPLVKGYEDGEFHGKDKVKAGAFAKVLVGALGLSESDTNTNQLNTIGLIGSNLSFEKVTNDDYKKALEILSNIVILKYDADNYIYLETLVTGFTEFTGENMFQQSYPVDADKLVTRAMMSKVITNTYEYLAQKNERGRVEQVLGDATIIGDKLELIANSYGYIAASNTINMEMESGDVAEFGNETLTYGGLPITYYWASSDGTMEDLFPNERHRKVRFTAPEVTVPTTVYVKKLVQCSNGKQFQVTRIITVNPENNPPATQPTTQASNLRGSQITPYPSVSLDVDKGNGQYRIITCTPSAYTPEQPTDGPVFGNEQNYQDALPISSGSRTRVVYSGTGSTDITVTGLDYNSTYKFQAYEYNKDGSTGLYLKDSPAKTTITIGAAADFQVDFFQNPPTAMAGEEVDFFSETKNADLSSIRWSFEGANISTKESRNALNVVFNAPGEYQVSMEATNAFDNSDEKTMTKTVVIRNPETYFADLTTTELTINKPVLSPSGFIKGTAVVNNSGEQIAKTGWQGSRMQLFYSEDNILDDNDPLIDEIIIQDDISGNSSLELELEGRLPSTVTVGTRYLIAVVDGLNGVEEGDENNNTQAFEFAADNTPDFAWSNISVPSQSYESGSVIPFSYTIENFGDYYSPAGYISVSFRISEDLNFDKDDRWFAEVRGTTIRIGSNVSELTIPRDLANGSYYIVAGVNYDPNVVSSPVFPIPENNLENNFVAYQFTVNNPNQPSQQTKNIVASNISETTADLSWTRGDGDGIMILVRDADSRWLRLPEDGIAPPNANADYGLAEGLQYTVSGESFNDNFHKIVYDGTGTSVSVSGLETNKSYLVYAYEYNNSGASIDYLQSQPKETLLFTTSSRSDNWNILMSADESHYRYPYVFFTDENNGSVMSTARIIRTVNGGETWQEQNQSTGSSIFYTSSPLYFNQLEGWALADNQIVHTSDRGINWHSKHQMDDMFYLDIGFFEEKTGIAVGRGNITTPIGDKGIISRTTDGGETWSNKLLPIRIYDLTVLNDTHAWVCGVNGMVYKTTDAGNSWNPMPVTMDGATRVNRIYFINENTGFATQGTTVFQSDNGGNTWKAIPDISIDVREIKFLNQSVGYLFGNLDGAPEALKTTDGGQTWTSIKEHLPTTLKTLWDVQVLSESQFIITDQLGGKVFKTTTGGLSVSINAPTVEAAEYCAGSIFNASFTTQGTFDAENTFTLQLSDESGAFSASPINLATLSGTSGGGFENVELPVNLPSGTYKLRVASSNPYTVSQPSGSFTINQKPTVSISASFPEVLYENGATLSLADYGEPSGGIFILNGTALTELNPATVGVGQYTLQYTVTSGTCESTAMKSFEIKEAISLSVSNLPESSYCAYATVTAEYTASGEYESSNQFIVELSDANGSFAEAIVIGSEYAQGAGSIEGILPYNSIYGEGYQIRVRSTNPEIISTPTTAFTINESSSNSVSIAADAASICEGAEITFTADYQTDGIASFDWLLNGISASTNAAVFTTSELNDGDLVSVRVTSDAVCALPQTANSNNIRVEVNEIVNPYLELFTQTTEVCQDQAITIEARFGNMGTSSPAITWEVNGDVMAETGYELTLESISQATTVTASMSSEEACASEQNTTASLTLNIDDNCGGSDVVGNVDGDPNGIINASDLRRIIDCILRRSDECQYADIALNDGLVNAPDLKLFLDIFLGRNNGGRVTGEEGYAKINLQPSSLLPQSSGQLPISIETESDIEVLHLVMEFPKHQAIQWGKYIEEGFSDNIMVNTVLTEHEDYIELQLLLWTMDGAVALEGETLPLGYVAYDLNADWPDRVSVSSSRSSAANATGNSVILEQIGGILEWEMEGQEISLYPNPSSSNINVSINSAYEGNVTVTCWNALGQRVAFRSDKKSKWQYEYSFKTSSLPAGIYVMTVQQGDQIKYIKWQKQ